MKPSKETLRKRTATRRRNAAKRKLRQAELHERRPDLAAAVRLTADGCSSDDVVRRRILWLAHERSLEPFEIQKAMTLKDYHLLEFAERHELSLDWLLCGDLNGLRRKPVKGPPIFTAADLVRFYARLSLEQRMSITQTIGNMTPKAGVQG